MESHLALKGHPSGQKSKEDLPAISCCCQHDNGLLGLPSLEALCPACLAQPPPSSEVIHPALSLATVNLCFQDFPNYQFGRLIGKGATSEVYEARQTKLNRFVAVKLLTDAQSLSPPAVRRFLIGAEAVAQLDHPNIIPIYEVGEHEKHPFYAMKLVPGQTLKARLSQGDLRLPDKVTTRNKIQLRTLQQTIARLMVTVAQAVAHAHEHGVLHRDLKPGNIILDGQGEPHLADFGLAKFVEDPSRPPVDETATANGTLVGTPVYMAPEQAAGQPASRSSDIYSLGAILYELLTGKPVFEGPTAWEIFRKVIEEEPRPPRSINGLISRDLETICLKCLEKDPHHRYASASYVAEELNRWLRGEPIQTRPGGPIQRAAKWIRRNTVLASLILSLLFGSGTALLLWFHSRERDQLAQETRMALIAEWIEKVGQLWPSLQNPSLPVNAKVLHCLRNEPFPKSSPEDVSFTFMFHAQEHPRIYVPFLAPWHGYLERTLQRSQGNNASLDLELLKGEFSSLWPHSVRMPDLVKLDAYSYLCLSQDGTDLIPLALEKMPEPMVLFVRSNHPLASSQEVRTPLTIGAIGANYTFWGQRHLLQARPTLALNAVLVPAHPRSPIHAQILTILRVVNRQIDIGVVPRKDFEDQKIKGITEIMTFELPPHVYLAHPRLGRNTLDELTRALCRWPESSNFPQTLSHSSLGQQNLVVPFNASIYEPCLLLQTKSGSLHSFRR